MKQLFALTNEERKKRYAAVLAENGFGSVALVVDEKIENFGGPILAILTGLKSIDADYCLTLPVDMPLLKPQVAKHLFNQVNDFNVAVPMWPNGKLENLIMALKRPQVLSVIVTLCYLNRSRPLDILRAASKVLLVNIVGELQPLDPELKSFVNINAPQDLVQLQARQNQGPITKNVSLNPWDLPADKLKSLQEASAKTKSDPSEAAVIFSLIAKFFESEKMFFWGALSRENEGKTLLGLDNGKIQTTSDFVAMGKAALIQAAHNYACEAQVYEDKQCALLAERTMADQVWCQSQVSIDH